MTEQDARTQQQSLQQYKAMTPSQIAAMTADAQGWKPEDGDEIEGTVLAIKSAYSDVKKADYPIVFVLSDTGEAVAVHCFQTVLENEMKQYRPRPGERVYVKRIGINPQQEVKKGESPTIRYAVYVARDNSNVDPWDHITTGAK